MGAGVLPRLARRGWATLPRVVPGERPLAHLARSLTHAFAARGGELDVGAVERRLDDHGSAGLVELAQHLLDLAEGLVGAVVFVDQAEELITRTGTEERTRFLRLLRGALQPDSPLRVVATLRSEFLGPSLVGAGLADIVDDTVVVGPLPRERLFEVIEKPARRAGLDFEAGLVPRMVDDTVGGDSLPLLAYTLRQLYDRAEPGRPIRHDDYEAVGGVVGALRRQADAVVRTLAPRHPHNGVLAVLLRLVSVERGGEPVRRRVRRDALRADEDKIVQAFVDARLLRSDELDDEVVVEVAHEALLRQWEPLRAAVEASRRTLELRAEIEEDARSWDQAGREDSYLLRGVRLAAAEELSEDYVHDLGVLEQEFLSASRTLAGKELETARRSNRRLRRLAAGLITFLVLAVAASSLAVVRTVAAERAEQKARSGQLATQAVALLDTRPETALLLALEAVRTAGTTEAVAALQDGLSRPHHVATQLLGHENTVYDVAFSPDGSTLASAGADRTVRLWDLRTRRALGPPLRGHENSVHDVAFSPDGSTLASAGADRTVRLWNVRTRRALGQPLRGHDGRVWGVAFSPDGQTLASAGGNRTVRLWNVRTRRALGQPLRGHERPVTAVAFSPDGSTLASAGADQTVRLWNVRTRRALGEPLRGHENWAYDVAFSSDGQTLASSSWDRTVRLWDPRTRRALGEPLRGHDGRVWGVTFSPDGQTVASAGGDRAVRLWNLTASWVSEACRLANRNLSRSEWSQFLGEAPYVRTCPTLPSGLGAPLDAPGARYRERLSRLTSPRSS